MIQCVCVSKLGPYIQLSFLVKPVHFHGIFGIHDPLILRQTLWLEATPGLVVMFDRVKRPEDLVAKVVTHDGRKTQILKWCLMAWCEEKPKDNLRQKWYTTCFKWRVLKTWDRIVLLILDPVWHGQEDCATSNQHHRFLHMKGQFHFTDCRRGVEHNLLLTEMSSSCLWKKSVKRIQVRFECRCSQCSPAVWGGGRRQRKEDLFAATVSSGSAGGGPVKKRQEVLHLPTLQIFLSQYKTQQNMQISTDFYRWFYVYVWLCSNHD